MEAYDRDPLVMNIFDDSFRVPQAAIDNYEQDYSSVLAIADDAPVDPDAVDLTASTPLVMDQACKFASYSKLIVPFKTLLYPGNRHTILSVMMRQMVVKHKRQKSNACSDDDIHLLKDVLSWGNNCPRNFYKVKTMIRILGLEHVQIHACVNHCKEHDSATFCPVCSDQVPQMQGGVHSSRKVLRYFLLEPRFQLLFMSRKTARYI